MGAGVGLPDCRLRDRVTDEECGHRFDLPTRLLQTKEFQSSPTPERDDDDADPESHPFGRGGSAPRPTPGLPPRPYPSAVLEGGEGEMRKHIVMAAAVVVTIVAGLIGFGTATASTGRPQGTTLLATEPYEQSTETDVDLGDPGFSVADQSTFRFEIYDATETKHLGFETSQCVVSSIVDTTYTFQCQTNVVFTGGQILLAGMLSGSTVDGPPHALIDRGAFPPIYRFAITGGTQAYDGVQVQLDCQSGPDAVPLPL